MKIEYPTYVISELEGDAQRIVTECRRRFNPQVIDWPVDITIAGSSGVGPISFGQSLEAVVDKLRSGFDNVSGFTFDFISLGKFPNTGVYYLEPERERFDSLHESVINSGIKFDKNKFPYNPHCTLRFGPQTDAAVEEYLSSLALPKCVSISCFSIYQVNHYEAKRLHKF